MITSNLQVQHVLRAYSQQLSVRSTSSRDRANKSAWQKDEVTFSQESRKRVIADKIAREIFDQIMKGGDRNETTEKIMTRLSGEYGEPLDVGKEGEKTVFKVLGGPDRKPVRLLSPEETEQVKSRLVDITQSIVYDTLL